MPVRLRKVTVVADGDTEPKLVGREDGVSQVTGRKVVLFEGVRCTRNVAFSIPPHQALGTDDGGAVEKELVEWIDLEDRSDDGNRQFVGELPKRVGGGAGDRFGPVEVGIIHPAGPGKITGCEQFGEGDDGGAPVCGAAHQFTAMLEVVPSVPKRSLELDAADDYRSSHPFVTSMGTCHRMSKATRSQSWPRGHPETLDSIVSDVSYIVYAVALNPYRSLYLRLVPRGRSMSSTLPAKFEL